MLHHACEPTHPEPTSQDTLQTENVHLTHPCFPRMCAIPSWTNVPRHTTNFNPKIFISHIPILNFAGGDYTSHVCQPCTNVAKIHHKTSDPKIFISHIPLSNFAGAALHITQRMCANPSWTNVPKHTTNFRSDFFRLTHACFELCRNNSEQSTPRMCANPEPTLQRYTTKPQTLRISSHTSVLNFVGAALHITPRMCANPSWTNVPKHTTNFRSENVHLTHPCFELCRNTPEQITPRMCANPSWRHTTKPQTPRFSSHTSPFWTLPEQLSILQHACVPTLNQRSKDTPQNLRP